MKPIYQFIILLLSAAILSGCKDYLDIKPDKKLSLADNLVDLQGLMETYNPVNTQGNYAGEVAADNFYLTETELASIAKDGDRRMYTWENDNIFQEDNNSWNNAYLLIYHANTVLENIKNIPRTPTNFAEHDNVKGQAYFLKGASLLQAAFIWTQAYDSNTADQLAGLPIRAGTDFNIKSKRSSLGETYDQAIRDLKSAVQFLPVRAVQVTRSSRPAAFAMLSRAYLSIRDYKNARLYADSVLQINSELTDYNTLSTTAATPISKFSKEVLFHWMIAVPPILNQARAKVDPALFAMFSESDLRKKVFFKNNGNGTYAFKGNYSGSGALFVGPAIDEVYLTRAECLIREGKITEGLNDLNALYVKRWDKTKPFVPFTATTKDQALDIILKERRKELIGRGLRWVDIKRLNFEGANITLSRTLGPKSYLLKPNDLRYAMPLPEEVIALTGMQQNSR